MRTTTRLLLLLAACGAAACTVKETSAPPLTGPSELSLRVGLQVVPDSILQDGASQAVLAIEATGGDGRPVRGLPLRVETWFNDVQQDFGTLSAKSVTTGDDGRARVIYTAPPRPSEPSDVGTVVSLRVIPIGNDFTGEIYRSVALRLVTPGVVLPPNNAPQPQFTYTPSSPLPLTNVVFDASTTTDEGVACGPSCTYAWDFGDGTNGSGIFATHQFRSTGTYQVRLTATDSRGSSATLAQAVQVGAGVPPTASFTFSPSSNIATGQTIFFTAEASRPSAGRRIVSYDWNFGSGRTGTGVTTTKTYDTPGTYVVTLTVTDDAGGQGTTSQSVTVGSSGATSLTAAMTVTTINNVTPATTATPFLFDASASRGPSPITQYRFNVGDGTPEAVQTIPTWQHTYTKPGIYVASVTVRDATGRTARADVTVVVNPAP